MTVFVFFCTKNDSVSPSDALTQTAFLKIVGLGLDGYCKIIFCVLRVAVLAIATTYHHTLLQQPITTDSF